MAATKIYAIPIKTEKRKHWKPPALLDSHTNPIKFLLVSDFSMIRFNYSLASKPGDYAAQVNFYAQVPLYE